MPEPERAILVAVELKGRDELWSLEDTLGELRHLTESAGAESGRGVKPMNGIETAKRARMPSAKPPSRPIR
jgi:hypothetical protein